MVKDRGQVRGRGILLVLIGAGLVGAAFVTLTWYSTKGSADSVGDRTFSSLRHNVDQLQVPVAAGYFDWLGWTLAIAVLVIGIAANLPTRVADPLRVLGFLLGAAGVAATYYALDQLFHAQGIAGGTGSIWHHPAAGMWCALGGFALAGLGAVLGPRRPG